MARSCRHETQALHAVENRNATTRLKQADQQLIKRMNKFRAQARRRKKSIIATLRAMNKIRRERKKR